MMIDDKVTLQTIFLGDRDEDVAYSYTIDASASFARKGHCQESNLIETLLTSKVDPSTGCDI
jgi:hypothetical protein